MLDGFLKGLYDFLDFVKFLKIKLLFPKHFLKIIVHPTINCLGYFIDNFILGINLKNRLIIKKYDNLSNFYFFDYFRLDQTKLFILPNYC